MSARQLPRPTQPQAADMRAAGRRIASITACTSMGTKSVLVSMANTTTHCAALGALAG
jgi:hypothetical protein